MDSEERRPGVVVRLPEGSAELSIGEWTNLCRHVERGVEKVLSHVPTGPGSGIHELSADEAALLRVGFAASAVRPLEGGLARLYDLLHPK